ncbi:uncharacterized protein EAE97_011520 [Botrytis byssoidea]|uniref:Uncharacterized protein n=1 Tax=Botrytis byssoidea TaxID=139641 RepID=A0A9P5LH66_9HELO|nr:uncharacterized protein EAE97_011520 [Botrytis byssoidea]KAF7920179.1 hypothetical protein EAE97_011520 [Botrytis byssoidea]
MPSKVELTRMSQQTGTKCMDDDWTGTSDSTIRRKLQNRLNQRIYRESSSYGLLALRLGQRRKALSKTPEDRENDSLIEAPQLQERSILGEAKSTHSANPLSITTSLRNEEQSSQFERPSNSSTTSSADISIKRWTTGRVSRYQGFCEIRLMLATFEEEARRNYSMGSPQTDQLLTLIQFNVFRALIKNTRTMGWNLDWLDCTIDPLSPWLNLSTKFVPGAHCPQALCPTNIQRTIPHHPWLDLWPIPQMRDNLLLHAGSYDEDRLCNDLVEFGGLMNEQSGLIV